MKKIEYILLLTILIIIILNLSISKNKNNLNYKNNYNYTLDSLNKDLSLNNITKDKNYYNCSSYNKFLKNYLYKDCNNYSCSNKIFNGYNANANSINNTKYTPINFKTKSKQIKYNKINYPTPITELPKEVKVRTYCNFGNRHEICDINDNL